MRHSLIILNKSRSVLTDSAHPKCETPKYCQTNKNGEKVLYIFCLYSQLFELRCQKSSKVTGNFYKTVVLRKLRNNYKSCRPKTGLKYMYLRLLHDNAPAHKAPIITEFSESEKLPSFHTLRFCRPCPSPNPRHCKYFLFPSPHPHHRPCNYFLFPNLK